MLLAALKVEPPAKTPTDDELAALFRDPDLHTLGQPYLLTPDQTQPGEPGQPPRVEVIDRRPDGPDQEHTGASRCRAGAEERLTMEPCQFERRHRQDDEKQTELPEIDVERRPGGKVDGKHKRQKNA